MNGIQIYELCMMFVGIHLLALPAFVWAMKRRQMKLTDKAVYEVLDEAPEAALPAAAPFPKWRLRLMLGTLVAVFSFILWSSIVFLHAAYAGAPTPGSATQKAVCPFGFK